MLSTEPTSICRTPLPGIVVKESRKFANHDNLPWKLKKIYEKLTHNFEIKPQAADRSGGDLTFINTCNKEDNKLINLLLSETTTDWIEMKMSSNFS